MRSCACLQVGINTQGIKCRSNVLVRSNSTRESVKRDSFFSLKHPAYRPVRISSGRFYHPSYDSIFTFYRSELYKASHIQRVLVVAVQCRKLQCRKDGYVIAVEAGRPSVIEGCHAIDVESSTGNAPTQTSLEREVPDVCAGTQESSPTTPMRYYQEATTVATFFPSTQIQQPPISQ